MVDLQQNHFLMFIIWLVWRFLLGFDFLIKSLIIIFQTVSILYAHAVCKLSRFSNFFCPGIISATFVRPLWNNDEIPKIDSNILSLPTNEIVKVFLYVNWIYALNQNSDILNANINFVLKFSSSFAIWLILHSFLNVLDIAGFYLIHQMQVHLWMSLQFLNLYVYVLMPYLLINIHLKFSFWVVWFS